MKSKPSTRGYVHGYIRVSTERQADSGLSLAAQRQKAMEYARVIAKRKGLVVGRIFADKAVSATKHALTKRPAGSQLDAAIQRGDHVVIVKLDRAFRSTRDSVLTCERWMSRGVAIHFLDLGVDTDTAVGRMLVSILATIAQWEAERLGDRNRDAKAQMKARGLATNGVRRLGYVLGRGGKLRPHPQERSIARRISILHERGTPWREIADRLTREKIRRFSGNGGTTWTHQACRRLYVARRASWRL